MMAAVATSAKSRPTQVTLSNLLLAFNRPESKSQNSKQSIVNRGKCKTYAWLRINSVTGGSATFGLKASLTLASAYGERNENKAITAKNNA